MIIDAFISKAYIRIVALLLVKAGKQSVRKFYLGYTLRDRFGLLGLNTLVKS
jgi:hypothetical protein